MLRSEEVGDGAPSAFETPSRKKLLYTQQVEQEAEEGDALREQRQKTPIATRIPQEGRRPPIVPATTPEPSQRGVPGFFGIWPGDETDEDLGRMLEDLRGRRRKRSL
jgi:hypothetical protein